LKNNNRIYTLNCSTPALQTKLIMKNILKYSLILTVILTLQSCAPFKDLEFKGIHDYKVEEFSLKGVKINLGVKLDNPNWFAIKASGGSINIKANGVNLGSFKLTKPVKLPKNSDGVVNIGIESKFKNLLGSGVMSLLSLATNGGKLKLELEGYVRASALGLRKKIKVSTTEYIGL